MGLLTHEPVLVTNPPNDDRRFLYTYIGRRLLGGTETINYYDLSRTRPALVVGTTGSGKTELMASMAAMDNQKGRCTIFIDGKCDINLMQKLYYYTRHGNKDQPQRPFYCLIPHPEYDTLTHSWNPLFLTTVEPSTISETVFNSYSPPESEGRGEGSFYSTYQRQAFSLICSALLKSGKVASFQDIVRLLTYPEIMDSMAGMITQEGTIAFRKLVMMRRENPREFNDRMRGFVNFLMKFSHHSLNSCNPAIQLDRLVFTESFIYVGLPLNLEPHLMRALGNILINQLKSLTHRLQSSNRLRRSIACYVDEAGSFIDSGAVDWINKVRSTGLMLTLSIQLLGDLQGRRPGFSEQVPGNTPNVYFFQTRDPATATWFSELSGRQLGQSQTASVRAVEGEVTETGAGSARMSEQPRISRDLGYNLRPGQMYFLPESTIRPMLLAGAYMPDPSGDPQRTYVREVYNPDVEVSGLQLNYVISADQKNFAAQQQRARN
jgi:hypothetical protein